MSRDPATRAELAVLALILVLAAAIRFGAIGARSLWFDEAFSYEAANRPVQAVIAFAATNDTHPPLYYVILSLWMRLFGSSETALRSLGAIFGTLMAGGAWWLGRWLGGARVGLVAALLTSVAPLAVLSAQEARMYPLLGFFTVCSWAGLLAGLGGRRSGWLVYVLAGTLALYTHYFAFLNLMGQAVYVLVAVRPARQAWLVSQLAIAILFLPWAATLLNTLQSGTAWPFWRPPLGAKSLTSLLGLLSFGGHVLGFAGYHLPSRSPASAQAVVLLPFLGLMAAGTAAIWGQAQKRWLLVGYLVVPVAVTLAFSLWHNIYYARYFSYILPAFAVMLALGIEHLSRRVPSAFRRLVVLALTMVLVAVNGLVLNDAQTNPRYNYYNWRGAAALLTAQAGAGDLIVAFPGFAVIPLSYYFKGPQRIEPMTPREYLDVTGGKVRDDPEVHRRNLEVLRSYAAAHPVMWIVATLPMPAAALERLQRLLTGIYDAQGIANFGGIRVFKMTRNPGWETAR